MAVSLNNLGVNLNDMLLMSQIGGQMSYYQGMNPYLGQVGQSNGQMLADQANMMSSQFRSAMEQNEQMKPILELQRKRSLVDIITDPDMRKAASAELDRLIMEQLSFSKTTNSK